MRREKVDLDYFSAFQPLQGSSPSQPSYSPSSNESSVASPTSGQGPRTARPIPVARSATPVTTATQGPDRDMLPVSRPQSRHPHCWFLWRTPLVSPVPLADSSSLPSSPGALPWWTPLISPTPLADSPNGRPWSLVSKLSASPPCPPEFTDPPFELPEPLSRLPGTQQSSSLLSAPPLPGSRHNNSNKERVVVSAPSSLLSAPPLPGSRHNNSNKERVMVSAPSSLLPAPPLPETELHVLHNRLSVACRAHKQTPHTILPLFL
ncbi:hypothetical protein ACLB2K_046573 [Fragaria x ananassa]